MLVSTRLKTRIFDDSNYRGFHWRKEDVSNLVNFLYDPKNYVVGCVEHKGPAIGPIINAYTDQEGCLIGDFLIDTNTPEGESVAKDVESGKLTGGSLQTLNFPLRLPDKSGEPPLIGGKILIEGSLVNAPDDPNCHIISYKRLTEQEYNDVGMKKGCKSETKK